jgi:hypothetical protein
MNAALYLQGPNVWQVSVPTVQSYIAELHCLISCTKHHTALRADSEPHSIVHITAPALQQRWKAWLAVVVQHNTGRLIVPVE